MSDEHQENQQQISTALIGEMITLMRKTHDSVEELKRTLMGDYDSPGVLERIRTLEKQERVAALERQVAKWEGSRTWLTRTIGSVVIGLLIALVVSGIALLK